VVDTGAAVAAVATGVVTVARPDVTATPVGALWVALVAAGAATGTLAGVGARKNAPCVTTTAATSTGTSPITGTSHQPPQRCRVALRADRTACARRDWGGVYGPGTGAPFLPKVAYRTPRVFR
jgi:hypothetical protein